MSKSNAAETGILKLIYQAVTWTGIAVNDTGTPLTNIHVALMTADPGEAGTMSTSEATYPSYARVNVARTTGGWTESSGTITPVAAITFPAGTGGSGTVTNFATGFTGGGAVAIIHSGTVTPSIVTGNGITPQLTTATAIAED